LKSQAICHASAVPALLNVVCSVVWQSTWDVLCDSCNVALQVPMICCKLFQS